MLNIDNKDKFESLLVKLREDHDFDSDEVILDRLKLEPGDVKNLIVALKENNSLEHLRIRLTQLGEDGFVAIAGALSYNKSLKNLDISDVEISPKAVKVIADSIKARGVGLKIEVDDEEAEKAFDDASRYVEEDIGARSGASNKRPSPEGVEQATVAREQKRSRFY